MGPLLNSVKQLNLSTTLLPDCAQVAIAPSIRTLVAACSPLLACVARACPNLKGLFLDGEIGLALSAFASCPKITQLDLVCGSIPVYALHQIHELFPALQHLEVRKVDVDAGGIEDGKLAAAWYGHNVAHALSFCANLKTLILPWLRISQADTWTYLPRSLTVLKIYDCTRPPPPGTQLPALKELLFYMKAGPDGMGVRVLAAILQAAPCLSDLSYEVLVSCHADEPPNIMVVYKRIKTGLVTKQFRIYNLTADIGLFLSSMGPLPAIKALDIAGRLPSDSVHEVVRVFPNLHELTVAGPGFIDNSEDLLVGLESLTSLCITCCSDMTDVRVLGCMRLPRLTILMIAECPNVSTEEVLQAHAREGLEIIRE